MALKSICAAQNWHKYKKPFKSLIFNIYYYWHRMTQAIMKLKNVYIRACMRIRVVLAEMEIDPCQLCQRCQTKNATLGILLQNHNG